MNNIRIFVGNGMLRFANYLQDHMVLQRAPQKAVVWGFSDPSTVTTLIIDGKTYTTISESEPKKAQNESIWSVTLDPVSEEGPFDIHVSQSTTSGNVTITLHDVLFDDVWICSGQSNMELTVGMIYNGSTEINNTGNYPKIRVFTSGLVSAGTPSEELAAVILKWSVALPQSIGRPDWMYMSAVCWLHGRMIHQALDGRPIGLVASSWGGTVIELWMPLQALIDCGIPTRMVIYGAIWYQGEANANYNTDKYRCAFSRMISYWRQTWYNRTNGLTDVDFPFGFVQLSTFANTTRVFGTYPILRWHQTFDVGYRLSRAGLAVAYGQQIEFQGPIVEKVDYISGSSTINVTYTGVTSLEIRNPGGFDLCCSVRNCSIDWEWTSVNITSKNGLTVTVPNDCIGHELVGIHYLWRSRPCLFKQIKS